LNNPVFVELEMPAVAVSTIHGVRVVTADLLAAMGAKRLKAWLKALTTTAVKEHGAPPNWRPKVLFSYREHRKAAASNVIEGFDIGAPWHEFSSGNIEPLIKAGHVLPPIEHPSFPLPGAAPCFATPISSDLVPHPYQTVVLEEIAKRLSEDLAQQRRARMYLKMGTGLGKTLTACMAITGPTLVIVPVESTRTQWMQTAEKMYFLDPDTDERRPVRVGAYENRHEKCVRKRPAGSATHDIVVIIVNTARQKTSEFFAQYNTVIIDEAHELSTPTATPMLWELGCVPKILALSATPNADNAGLNIHVAKYMGGVCDVETLPGFDPGENVFTGTVTKIRYCGNPAYTEAVQNAGMNSSMLTMKRVFMDPSRRLMVTQQIKALHDEDLGVNPATKEQRQHTIIVFAEMREQVQFICDDLAASGLTAYAPELVDEAAGAAGAAGAAVTTALIGGAGAETLNAARFESRIIVTTYQYTKRGVDIVKATCLVLATSRKSNMMQITGRIVRVGSDTTICRRIIDVVDEDSFLKSQFRKRKAAYAERAFDVEEIHAQYAA
jgi:superfamily II DNA or RNA helicase